MDKALKFWQEQAEWSEATFGPSTTRGPLGPLKHLAKEVDEAIVSVMALESGACIAISPAPDYQHELEMEITDCLFLVFDAARRAGMSYDSLIDLAFKKLVINKGRRWVRTSDDEPVEHDRSLD